MSGGPGSLAALRRGTRFLLAARASPFIRKHSPLDSLVSSLTSCSFALAHTELSALRRRKRIGPPTPCLPQNTSSHAHTRQANEEGTVGIRVEVVPASSREAGGPFGLGAADDAAATGLEPHDEHHVLVAEIYPASAAAYSPHRIFPGDRVSSLTWPHSILSRGLTASSHTVSPYPLAWPHSILSHGLTASSHTASPHFLSPSLRAS